MENKTVKDEFALIIFQAIFNKYFNKYAPEYLESKESTELSARQLDLLIDGAAKIAYAGAERAMRIRK